MESVLRYHIVPGSHDLFAIPPSNKHNLFSTALAANLDNNQTQQLVIQRSLPPGNPTDQQIPVVEIPDQVLETKVTGSLSLNGTNINIINTVLGYPSTYTWEANNTGLMQEWNAFTKLAKVVDVESSVGYTIFAPADKTWDALTFVNEIPPSDVHDVYNNHVISGVTVWSPNFTTGVYTSGSGFTYAFNVSLNGQMTVSLNGTAANITRSDILTQNGVIHLLDGPLWKSSANAASGLLDPSPSASGGTPSTSSVNDAGNGGKGGISTGTVAGIVVAAVVALCSAIIVLFGLYKRRQRHIKVLVHQEENLYIDEPDLPTAALRTTPFTSSHDLTEPRRAESAASVTSQATPSGPSEKSKAQLSYANRVYYLVSAASSNPAAMPEFPQMSQEVMERLLQSISIRIDSAEAPSETDEAPPEYYPTR
ncbi:hypothetical protein BC629DRAFT_214922 [Irpex lacteus]|nr:hypothetical protein BC629DRAFT_214922 [Irpex lacteus]